MAFHKTAGEAPHGLDESPALDYAARLAFPAATSAPDARASLATALVRSAMASPAQAVSNAQALAMLRLSEALMGSDWIMLLRRSYS